MEFPLHLYKMFPNIINKGVNMTSLPLGNDNDLNDAQFYNRIDEISFIRDNLEITKKGSTPTILLTGIRGVGKTALMKKLKKDFQNDYLVVYMDLSAMDKFKTEKLTRFIFMKLFYESIIKACRQSNIKTIDKQILKYFKTRNFKLDKLESIDNIPIPILNSQEDYAKFATFAMDLPQQIYDDCKEDIDGVLIFLDEFQILKQLDEDVNGFLWYIRSVIQSQNHIGYIFSGSMSIKDELIADIAPCLAGRYRPGFRFKIGCDHAVKKHDGAGIPVTLLFLFRFHGSSLLFQKRKSPLLNLKNMIGKEFVLCHHIAFIHCFNNDLCAAGHSQRHRDHFMNRRRQDGKSFREQI
jgi:hypothetical protein